ncbi:MAG TPA: membrane protein insertion efficiency factor YidD, partial [Fibrobacteria bacterium]|nr:membrane protein insertion efficiency factor YidD [Fibrobacteria bacterium]
RPALTSIALILILANLGPIAIAGISCYQKCIAPALHMHCSYAHATGKESCSAYTKRMLAEKGALYGLPLCLQRFQACARTGKGTVP